MCMKIGGQTTGYELIEAPNCSVPLDSDEAWNARSQTSDEPSDPAKYNGSSLKPAEDCELGDTPPLQQRFPPWALVRDTKELRGAIFVFCTVIPIIVLAVCAPTLSSALGAEACLPNGDFVRTLYEPK